MSSMGDSTPYGSSGPTKPQAAPDTSSSQWPRRPSCGWLLCSALQLALVSPLLFVYTVLAAVGSLVAVPVLACVKRRGCRRALRGYRAAATRLLHLGPTGPGFDGALPLTKCCGACNPALVVDYALPCSRCMRGARLTPCSLASQPCGYRGGGCVAARALPPM